MKKKLFSRGLYTEGLRQLRLTGVILLIISLFIGVIVPIVQYINYVSYRIHDEFGYEPEVVEFLEMCPITVGIFTVAALVFTLILFGSFNRRNASDFYHSLPYTRTCVFLSFSAAIFTWIIGMAVVTCAVTLGVYGLFPQLFIINLNGMFDILLTLFACSVIIVFGVIAAMSITGTPVANITAAGLILFLPRLIVTLFTFALGNLAPIIEGHFGIFNPEHNVFVGMLLMAVDMVNVDPFTENIPADIYSIFVGLVYGVIALVLFNNRKSETAGQSAPAKKVQAAIRICVALVISLIVTTVLMDDFEIAIAVVFYSIAVLAYFIYELITTKRFKNLIGAIPGLAVVVVLNIAFVAGCFGASMITHAYTPEVNDVSAIYIMGEDINYNYQIDFSEYATQAASTVKIDDKEAIGYACKNLKESVERSKDGKFHANAWIDYDEYESKEDVIYYSQLSLTYVSKNGVERQRNIYMPQSDYEAFMNAIQSNDAYKEKFFEIPEAILRTVNVRDTFSYHDMPLTDEEEMIVLDMIRDELKDISFADWMSYLNYSNGTFDITYQTEESGARLRLKISSELFPETVKYIMEKANSASKDEIDRIYTILEDVDGANEYGEYWYWHMTLQGYKDNAIAWELWGIDRYDTEELMKELAEKMKAGELDTSSFVIATIEYEENLEGEEGVSEFKYATVFLPYPEDFEPDPDIFDVYEDYKIEHVIVD